MKPNVSIIILNWNGWEDTIECLESVYQIDYPNYNVIIVDNGSEDDSIKKIKEYCKGAINVKSDFFEYNATNKPINLLEMTKKESEVLSTINYEFEKLNSNKKLILIKNNENYGFAEGNNIGIKFALNFLNNEYILLLNNDTVVDKNLIFELINTSISDENIALTQAKILYHSKPKFINTTGNIIDRYGGFKSRGWNEKDYFQYDKYYNQGFFYASGACVLINKNFLVEYNSHEFFDKAFFAYHEDMDISFIARLLGFRIFYSPRAICFHKEGSSIKKKPALTATYLSFKNNIRLILKNYSIKSIIWILPISIMIDFFLSILAMIKNRNLKYFLFFIKAIAWNIINIKDSLKKRKYIQSKRIINDDELFMFMEKGSIKISDLLFKFRKVINKKF